MAEKLFWAVFEHLSLLSPDFVSGAGRKRFASKFKRVIHLVDSTTIQLIAACMDWAKHRRRKAKPLTISMVAAQNRGEENPTEMEPEPPPFIIAASSLCM